MQAEDIFALVGIGRGNLEAVLSAAGPASREFFGHAFRLRASRFRCPIIGPRRA